MNTSSEQITPIDLSHVPGVRRVCVDRARRRVVFSIAVDGRHLRIVGRPWKKSGELLEGLLGEMADKLMISRQFLQESIEDWVNQPGVSQDLALEIRQ